MLYDTAAFKPSNGYPPAEVLPNAVRSHFFKEQRLTPRSWQTYLPEFVEVVKKKIDCQLDLIEGERKAKLISRSRGPESKLQGFCFFQAGLRSERTYGA